MFLARYGPYQKQFGALRGSGWFRRGSGGVQANRGVVPMHQPGLRYCYIIVKRVVGRGVALRRREGVCSGGAVSKEVSYALGPRRVA